MKKLVPVIIIALLCITQVIKAQELNFNVTVNTPTLRTADPKVFKTLETAIQEFYNNTVWTDDEFEPFERIEGALQINIVDDISANTFVADFYLSVSRPIFMSNSYTTLITHLDKNVTFSYEEFAPILNNSSSFSDNLSAILTFYAQVVLGLDYDSFSPYGGERFFQSAKNIAASIPTSESNRDKAWTATGGSRNRYWLIENLLNPRVRSYRLAAYEYHRQGLDNMQNDVEMGRANILGALKTMDDVNKSFPNSMILQVFSDTKVNELKDIFIVASPGEKRKVFDIMTRLDPAKAGEYTLFR